MTNGLPKYRKKPSRKKAGLVNNYSPRLALGILFLIMGFLIIFFHLIFKLIF